MNHDHQWNPAFQPHVRPPQVGPARSSIAITYSVKPTLSGQSVYPVFHACNGCDRANTSSLIKKYFRGSKKMSRWLDVGIFFSSSKTMFMKYYLIHQEGELKPIPGTPEQEIDFLLQYNLQILASGGTIREVLQIFHEMPLIFSNGL